MAAGTYNTTDPNKRVKLVFDENQPYESPDFPFAEGVLDVLVECYESGNYYGAILLEREVWVSKTTGEEREEWEEHDSIWGCAGYDNPAEDIAKEFFGMTVTEKI